MPNVKAGRAVGSGARPAGAALPELQALPRPRRYVHVVVVHYTT